MKGAGAEVPGDEELEQMSQAELRRLARGLREGEANWKRVWRFMTDQSRREYRQSRGK
jgi:hypothetical protein